MGQSRVAQGLKGIVRKLPIGELELLKSDHVRLSFAQPVQHELLASPQPVDVPSRDAHSVDLGRGRGTGLGERHRVFPHHLAHLGGAKTLEFVNVVRRNREPLGMRVV